MPFIRKITKGGIRRKPYYWSFVHSDEDSLRIGKADSFEDFVKKQN